MWTDTYIAELTLVEMTTGIQGGLGDEPLDHPHVASRAPDEGERSDVFWRGERDDRN